MRAEKLRRTPRGSGIQSLPTVYMFMPDTQGIHAMIRWPGRSSDWWFVDDKMQTFLWSVCLSMIEPFFFPAHLQTGGSPPASSLNAGMPNGLVPNT